MTFPPKKIIGSPTTFVQYFNFAIWNFFVVEKKDFQGFFKKNSQQRNSMVG